MKLRVPLLIFLLAAVVSLQAGPAFELPTANRAIYEKGAEERYFVGTVGKPWLSGTFGCVRTDGRQLHEGIDIRSLERDRRGESTDPVMAAADGEVVYLNRKSGLSNYGNYLVLRHQIEGLEVCTLYAHLREFASGIAVGQHVKAGQRIATLGRTTNTREGISKDRAHLHFEIGFQANARFAQWHAKFRKGERNDHGAWNGQNILGVDPWDVFREQQRLGKQFSLVKFIQTRTELFRVFIRTQHLPLADKAPGLVLKNPAVARDGLHGYEIGFDFNGVPVQIIPRTAKEYPVQTRITLLRVADAEAVGNGCRKLVYQQSGRWKLTTTGTNLLELLMF